MRNLEHTERAIVYNSSIIFSKIYVYKYIISLESYKQIT